MLTCQKKESWWWPRWWDQFFTCELGWDQQKMRLGYLRSMLLTLETDVPREGWGKNRQAKHARNWDKASASSGTHILLCYMLREIVFKSHSPLRSLSSGPRNFLLKEKEENISVICKFPHVLHWIPLKYICTFLSHYKYYICISLHIYVCVCVYMHIYTHICIRIWSQDTI